MQVLRARRLSWKSSFVRRRSSDFSLRDYEKFIWLATLPLFEPSEKSDLRQRSSPTSVVAVMVFAMSQAGSD
jgi:hypothetical protein